MSEDTNVWMTPKEVAKYLQVSERTLYRLISTGKWPKPRKFSPRLTKWQKSDVIEAAKKL